MLSQKQPYITISCASQEVNAFFPWLLRILEAHIRTDHALSLLVACSASVRAKMISVGRPKLSRQLG